MKPCDVPPRYLVRLPEGEREFDAPEILKLFMEFKIDTVTPVRPTGGGEWRELRQVPEFSFELYRRYRRLRDRMRTPVWSHWLYIGLLAFFPCFPSLCPPRTKCSPTGRCSSLNPQCSWSSFSSR